MFQLTAVHSKKAVHPPTDEKHKGEENQLTFYLNESGIKVQIQGRLNSTSKFLFLVFILHEALRMITSKSDGVTCWAEK